MISPASGIHRPSNNGAPARQTLAASKNEAMTCSVVLHSGASAHLNCYMRSTYPARLPEPLESRCGIKFLMRQSRNCERLLLILAHMTFDVRLVLAMFLMRCMRYFAQIKLRKQDKNKGLHERHEDSERHERYR